MHRIRAAIAAGLLFALSVGDVASDHGYWPAGGVDPAVVSDHEPRTPDNSTSSAWGSDCVTRAASGSGDSQIDVYGYIAQADYELAIVLAQVEGVPVEGPAGLTVFRDVKAGQFLWADVDGDGTFAGRHEADAGELILCGPTIPATDTDIADPQLPARALDFLPVAALLIAAVLGAMSVLIRARER